MNFQTDSNTGTPAPAKPDPHDFASDIPLDAAIRAHSGTSHSPERRGASEVSGYAQTLAADLAEFSALAEKHGTGDALAELFPRYRDAYRRSTLAHLSAKSRCISTMITGGSNFPVRRAEKANSAEHRRLEELLNCRALWRKRILKVIVPNADGPIMSGDADAVERLKEEIQKAETKQEHMKAVNAAIRKHAKAGAAAQLAALMNLGISEAHATLLLKPNCFGDLGFEPFELTNNNANIRRMKARLATIEKAHSTPTTEQEGTKARIEDCPAENRVRLFYPGKPDADIRATLKSSGFRWAPSLECWQAYRNERAMSAARTFAGIDG